MNIAPAHRTPTPRKSCSKRPARISPERWQEICALKRRLGYALHRGWLAEYTKAGMRNAAAENPEVFGNWANV